jgi:hypothetical protein
MIPNKSEMIQLRKVYGDEVVNWLSEVANSRAEVPKDNHELSKIITQIFAR